MEKREREKKREKGRKREREKKRKREREKERGRKGGCLINSCIEICSLVSVLTDQLNP